MIHSIWYSYYAQLPLCTPYPGVLSVLVMDNAKIHHGEEIAELLDAHGMSPHLFSARPLAHFHIIGVQYIYLPPYSPDFNPIEEAFSKIKYWIRRHHDIFEEGPGLIYDMLLVMNTVITPDDALGYIHHAGYF